MKRLYLKSRVLISRTGKINGLLLLIFMLACTSASCRKEFLEKKPNKALLIPTTLTDFQYLLDNQILNKVPALNIVAGDDLVNNGNLMGFSSPLEKSTYLWETDMYSGVSIIPDWEQPYQQIFYSNIVLDGLKEVKLASSQEDQYKRIKGSALFFRAFGLYNLAQNFSKPYDPNSATQDPGIPIRLSSDVNEIAKRGTVGQTYERIIADLEEAGMLLAEREYYKSRPSKHAAFALLARVYLSMQLYTKAESYASSALSIKNTLIDYNTLNSSAANPVPASIHDKNEESIFYALHNSYSFFSSALTTIDPSLYQLYDSNDLRKTIFFLDKGAGLINFKGSYNGDRFLFGGLATDEMYLIRAECLARRGQSIEAVSDLNELLIKRYKKGTFIPITAAGAGEALVKILMERRKEMVCRGLRWSDLRRLNKDPRFAVTLSRAAGGQTYTLLPGSVRYVFPIPENELAANEIEQNLR